MELVLTIIGSLAYYLISALQIVMIISAVLSFFPMGPQGRIVDFIQAIADAATYPVQYLMDKLGYRPRGMLNIPFFVTVILLLLLQSALAAVL